MDGVYGGNPYEIQAYRLPNGNVVNLTNQQARQLFGTQPPSMNVQTPPSPSLPNTVQPTTPSISGRFIASPDDIVPNEVPMDGRISFFPLNDCTAVYAKQWDSNGNIQTAKYILSVDAVSTSDESSTQSNLNVDELFQKLNSIEQKLEKIEKQRPYYKKPYSKPKDQVKEEQK